MEPIFQVLCGDCKEVEVSAKDLKLINVLDKFYPEEKGSYGHFIATCPCPGCALWGKPNQLFARVDPQTRSYLRKNGVEVIEYNPNVQGNVPTSKSLLQRLFSGTRKAHRQMQNALVQVQLLESNNPIIREAIDMEIDDISRTVDLTEFDELKVKRARSQSSNRPESGRLTIQSKEVARFTKAMTTPPQGISRSISLN